MARDPQRHDAWHLIAQAQQRPGRYSESLTAIEMALTVQPRNSTYHMLRGDLLMDLGRVVEARAAYDRALQAEVPASKHLDAIAFRLAFSGHGNMECYEHALALTEEARAAFERKAVGSFKPLAVGVALYRVGRWQEALAALDPALETRSLSDPFGGRYDLHDLALVRVMALWQLGRRNEAWTQYQEIARSLGAKNVMTEPMKRHVAELRREAARLIGSQLGPEPILQDIATRQVGPGDYPQWGGWSGRNNVGQGDQSPIDWDPGTFDRKTGAWDREKSRNIKWVSNLGSQTYGNPAVANGRIFIGTNNSHGHLKRYPPEVDLGVLLCFRESDGEFLWQHSCEKLPTGRVHDWPLQGICSSPLVEGDRLWVVTNRGEVVCLDTEGFSDGDDDGPVQGLREPLFRVLNNLQSGLDNGELPSQLRAALVNAGVKLPGQWQVGVASPGERWSVNEYVSGKPSKRHLQIDLVGEELHVRPIDDTRPEPQPVVATVPDRLWDGLGTPQVIDSLRAEFARSGMELPSQLDVQTLTPGKAWTLSLARDDGRMDVVVRQGAKHLDAVRTDFTSSKDQQQSDVVWVARHDEGARRFAAQHGRLLDHGAGDTLFVCTSNGVDEAHNGIPAPQAPSFIALDKNTAKVLWTDNSPGLNILHGQWSSPAYARAGRHAAGDFRRRRRLALQLSCRRVAGRQADPALEVRHQSERYDFRAWWAQARATSRLPFRSSMTASCM